MTLVDEIRPLIDWFWAIGVIAAVAYLLLAPGGLLRSRRDDTDRDADRDA